MGYKRGDNTELAFNPKSINFWKKGSIENKLWFIDSEILRMISEYDTYFEKCINNEQVDNMFCDLTFSWENVNSLKELKSRIFNAIRFSEIFVVIGYSFPYVNRSIDDGIFRNLLSVRRIIIQDPMSNERFEFIKERINELLDKRKGNNLFKPVILPRQDPSEFYLP